MRDNKNLHVLLAAAVMFYVFYKPLSSLSPVLVADVYNNSASELRVIITLGAIGVLCGTLLIAFLRIGFLRKYKRGRVLLSAGLLTGLGLVLTALIPNYWAGAISILILSIGAGGWMILIVVLAIGLTEPRYHGRVASLLLIITILPPLASTLIAGMLAETTSVQTAFGLFGMALVLFTLALFLTPIGRRLRQIR